MNTLKNIIDSILNGELVILSTDTVYGIIGNPFLKNTVDNLYKIKKRNKNKPLSIFLKDKNEIEKICIIDDFTRNFIFNKLENNTIILEKKDKNYLNLITNNQNNIGIRIPNDTFILNILNNINIPLFATSANISNEEYSSNYDEIIKTFSKDIKTIIKNKDSILNNKPSKIFKIENEKIITIRE